MMTFYFTLSVLILTAQSRHTNKRLVDRNATLVEEHYLALAYDLEVVLERHLKTWRYLTETPTTMDVGSIINRRWFNKRWRAHSENNYSEGEKDILKWLQGGYAGHFQHQRKLHKYFKVRILDKNNLGKRNNILQYGQNFGKTSRIHEINFKVNNESSQQNGPFVQNPKDIANSFDKEKISRLDQQISSKVREKRSSSSMPIMYMPGEKKKRHCVSANGIFSGFNAFSYLSFITGVISLILNVNNNINNNNNNNNLNTNNAVSNNNVDANSNSQTGNQIVVFPAGRKKHSLSTLIAPATTKLGENEKPSFPDSKPSIIFSDFAIDGVSLSLQVLSEAIEDGLLHSLKSAGYQKDSKSHNCKKENPMEFHSVSAAHAIKNFRRVQR